MANQKKRAPATSERENPALNHFDHAGHLAPEHAARLRRERESNETESEPREAFVTEPRSGDDLAEELGESAVTSMTSGEDSTELDETFSEELGGPFVATPAGAEFAAGTDESNTPDATREPFPLANRTPRRG